MDAWVIAGIIVAIIGFSILFGAPYVPSKRRHVQRLFAHMDLGVKDVLVDIGSGDGVVLRQATARGAKAIGYEVHPLLWVLSRIITPKATIHLKDFWRSKLPDDTTAVYLFGIHRDEKRVMKKMQAEANRLGRSIRFVTHGNPLPGVTPDDEFEAYSLYSFHPLQPKEA